MAIAGDPSPDPVVWAEVLDWIRNELGIPVVTSTGTTTTAAAHSRTTWAIRHDQRDPVCCRNTLDLF